MKNKYYLITLLILILDQVTKWIVRENLINGPAVNLITGYLSFGYESNTGVAFGLFNNIESAWKPYLLAAMAIIAVIVIFIYGRRVPADRKLLQCALAVTMGGILGNFVDRILHGYVIDFIEFHIQETFYWPTFNVADSSISIGIALLLIDTVKNPAPGEAAGQSTINNQS